MSDQEDVPNFLLRLSPQPVDESDSPAMRSSSASEQQLPQLEIFDADDPIDDIEILCRATPPVEIDSDNPGYREKTQGSQVLFKQRQPFSLQGKREREEEIDDNADDEPEDADSIAHSPADAVLVLYDLLNDPIVFSPVTVAAKEDNLEARITAAVGLSADECYALLHSVDLYVLPGPKDTRPVPAPKSDVQIAAPISSPLLVVSPSSPLDVVVVAEQETSRKRMMLPSDTDQTKQRPSQAVVTCHTVLPFMRGDVFGRASEELSVAAEQSLRNVDCRVTTTVIDEYSRRLGRFKSTFDRVSNRKKFFFQLLTTRKLLESCCTNKHHPCAQYEPNDYYLFPCFVNSNHFVLFFLSHGHLYLIDSLPNTPDINKTSVCLQKSLSCFFGFVIELRNVISPP